MSGKIVACLAFSLFCFLVVAVSSSHAGTLIGDIDFDGDLDDVDVNLLTGGIEAGTHDIAFDVDGNGLVTLPDLDLWFDSYSAWSSVPLATALVDVNFDGVNTIADFQIIASSLGSTTTDLTDGNLLPDGSSQVNQSDLDLYISRNGVVPEPTSIALALVGLCVAGRRNR